MRQSSSLVILLVATYAVFFTHAQTEIFLDQNDLAMQYTFNDTHITFTLSYPGNHWLAVGPNANNEASMVNTDAAVCLPDENTIRDTLISARSNAGIVDDDTNSLLDVSVSQTAGVTMCSWTRLLAANDDGDVAISTSDAIILNWARGVDNTLAFHADQGSVELVLSTGDVISYGGDSATVLVHGSLMFLAWNFFIPIGGIMAAFYKDSDGRWFRLHRFIQTCAVLMNIVAFAIIVQYTEANDKPHFGLPHQITGLVIFILSIIQPLNGFLRPHKEAEGPQSTCRRVWEYSHKGIGYLLMILGFYNINGGSNLLVDKNAFRIVWLIVSITIFLFYIFKGIQNCRRKRAGDAYQLKE